MLSRPQARNAARHAAARQLEHLERHPKDGQAEDRYIGLLPYLGTRDFALLLRVVGEPWAAWLKRQRAAWDIYAPLGFLTIRSEETYPEPTREQALFHIAWRGPDSLRGLRLDANLIARNLFPRARYAEGATWTTIKREGVGIMAAIIDAATAVRSDEPVIAFGDARAILDRLRALVGRIGYKLEMIGTIGGAAPQGRPDGLWAIPKNEPTGYLSRIDFHRCVHLTSDPNGIEEAILSCKVLPLLKPSGYRLLLVDEDDFPALSHTVYDQTEFLLRQLDIARERAARKAAVTT